MLKNCFFFYFCSQNIFSVSQPKHFPHCDSVFRETKEMVVDQKVTHGLKLKELLTDLMKGKTEHVCG